MEERRIVVIDTNAILNCPIIIDLAINNCDETYIPKVVIDELNYQKDKGTSERRRDAGLCLGKIIENRKHVNIPTILFRGTNDDKIFAIAEGIARKKVDSKVYLLTNDKDFLLKGQWCTENLTIISTKTFMDLTVQNNNYDVNKSKNFYDYVASGNVDEAKRILSGKIDINYISGDTGFTPLIQAIRNKDYEMVKYLVNLDKIDLNVVDEYKYRLPAISHAVQIHDYSMVKLLLEHGANVNEPSKNETNYFNTPLMIASWSGDYEIVKLLIEHRAVINQVDKKNGFTALIKAIINNENEIAKYLIEVGADKSIISFEGKTAYDYAVEKDNAEMIKILRVAKVVWL